MRKTLTLIVCIVLCLAAFASCNGEKLEDVNVAIIETTLHRENPEGVLGNSEYPYGAPVSDSALKESAKGYGAYIQEQGNKVHPGFIRLKEIYVENLSNDDVYVRVIATFPAAFRKEDDPVMDIRYCKEGENDSERGFTVAEKHDANGNYIMIFTYQKPLSAGEITYWPSLEAFGIKDSVPSEKIISTFEELGDRPFDVAVSANAITAKGYENAAEAFEDYDKNAVE